MREKTGARSDGVKAKEGIARDNVLGLGPRESEVIPRRIPRGLEVLIKKAAVDPSFKKLFLGKRADAATAIGLKLTAGEAATLAAVPLPQLEAIVANIKVSPKLRPAFLGYAAAVMLAALGATVGCEDTGTTPDPDDPGVTRGIRPDFPPTADTGGKIPTAEGENAENTKMAKTEYQERNEDSKLGGVGPGTGIRPDRP